MINSSLRRVARSYPNGSSISSRPTASSVAPFTSQGHRRRHSSSKPPVPPNNGSSTFPTSSVKQVGAPRSEEKRPGSESRLSKRKASKDKLESKEISQENWTSTLPSVPSLQHLNPKDVYVASFFSTHRPISITGPVPTEAQIGDVDKMFQPKFKAKARTGAADVIYTLTSAVENLDRHIADKNTDAAMAQRADIIKAIAQHNDNVQNPAEPHQPQHLDGTPQTANVRVPGGNVKLIIQEVARRFRPFNAPPPPVPVSDTEFDAREAEATAVEASEELQAKELELQVENQDLRSQTVEITVTIQGDSELQEGEFFTSNTAVKAPIEDANDVEDIVDPTKRTSIGGRTRHGVRIGEKRRRDQNGMFAISVKRQRRLKMKKHKYKKLMRRTRNLRRRQDRL